MPPGSTVPAIRRDAHPLADRAAELVAAGAAVAVLIVGRCPTVALRGDGKAGRRLAGRLLDGFLHDEYPEPADDPAAAN